MALRKRQTTAPIRPPADNGDDYVIPERIVLDDVSFATFAAEIENPREPNAALRALFKK